MIFSSLFSSVPVQDFEKTLSMASVIENLRQQDWYSEQLKYQTQVAESAANFADQIPPEINRVVVEALQRSLGITQLYSHQAKAIAAVLEGQSVVVATPTSSGKSLVYSLPILSSLVESKGQTLAFCIFPTKALAQDQRKTIQTIASALDDVDWISIATYDGDTVVEERRRIRERCNVILTNPDTLHASILPNHAAWLPVLKRLRYVVLDELHSYHGTFGSHVGAIIRRLRRLCSLLGNDRLQFVCSSATIGNPIEHLVNLTGLSPTQITLVTEDGSPRGQKELLLWDPPINPATKQKLSSAMEAVRLCLFLLKANVRTIVFCKNRKMSEIVTTLVHEQIVAQKLAAQPEALVQCYRGGYMAETRRELERALFSGKLKGVIATNALELGVDIGSLDAVIHLGCPASRSSLWQQAGRAGRRSRESLSIVVTSNVPLDGYFLKKPEELFSGNLELVQVDPFNPIIYEKHLTCAAFESPIDPPRDQAILGTGLVAALPATSLVQKAGVYHYDTNNLANHEWPAREISIRDIEEEHYEVVDRDTKAVLEEIEVSRAMFDVFPGAVYLHKGKTHVVEEVDFANRVAFVKRREVPYWTVHRDMTDIRVKAAMKTRGLANPVEGMEVGDSLATFGEVEVKNTVLGYRKVVPMTHALLEVVDLELPPYLFDTKGLWIDSNLLILLLLLSSHPTQNCFSFFISLVPRGVMQKLCAQGLTQEAIYAGIHSASHCLCSLAQIFIKCSPSDIRTECKSPYDAREKAPRYDPSLLLPYALEEC